MSRSPDVAVIIPTRNRLDSLWHTLGALSRQTYPADRFEVIVVDDGGTDDTARLTRCFAGPFALQVLTTGSWAGAATARNLGSRHATAPLLLFLDDDIEASPGLVAAHVAAQAAGADVTTGYLPTATEERRSFFTIALRGWWESMFASMRQRGHRYTFRDVLTGNCAIDAALFHEVGGFDASLSCHEDYELGVRLIAAGARVRFAPDAWGLHHEKTTLPRALARKRAEGRADVQIVRRHSRLWPVLPLGWFEDHASRRQRFLRRLAFRSPAAAARAATFLAASLAAREFIRARGQWTRTLNDLLTLAYWQGVASEVGEHGDFARLQRNLGPGTTPPAPLMEVDLASGLDASMRALDERRPQGVVLRYRAELVGLIPPTPGAEALRGEHLQAFLARDLATAFVAALGRAGVVPVTVQDEWVKASGRVPSDVLHA